MRIVLDANVLFRMLISQGSILDIFFDSKLELIAPERLKQEFLNNRKEILTKSSLNKPEFDELTEMILGKVSFISLKEYLPLFPKAKKLLGEHIKDIEFVALAIKEKTKIWTYEKLLIDNGTGISTQELKEAIEPA